MPRGLQLPSNVDIHSFLSRMNLQDYRGIFASDDIDPTLTKTKNFSIVVNILPINQSHQVGHFISIIGRANSVLYIDTLGMECIFPPIARFLEKCQRPIFYNEKQIQSMSSNYCGLFCILFVLFFDRKKKKHKNTTNRLLFYKKNKNLIKNDRLCEMYIRTFMISDDTLNC